MGCREDFQLLGMLWNGKSRSSMKHFAAVGGINHRISSDKDLVHDPVQKDGCAQIKTIEVETVLKIRALLLMWLARGSSCSDQSLTVVTSCSTASKVYAETQASIPITRRWHSGRFFSRERARFHQSGQSVRHLPSNPRSFSQL
jgi:hypothetical protein